MSNQELHLLLADDTPEHLYLLKQALTRHSSPIQISTVASGQELVQQLHRQRFDCLVLDYQLPDTTADQLLSLEADLFRNMPTLVISSNRDQEVVIAAMRCGVVDFIPKLQAMQGDELWRRVWMAVEESRRKVRLRHRAERRTRRLAAMAETDPLTGLSNRRHFQRLLDEHHWQNDRRESLCALMADIDHFKSINDRFGHSVGDTVLRHVAQSMRLQLDSSDALVRWGGEEFLILTPRRNMTESWILAQDLRQAITAGTRGLLPGDEPVTVSIGVNLLPSREFSAESIEPIDQALYLAKRLGRNCVVTANMVKLHQLAQNAAQSDLASLSGRYQQWLIWINPLLGPTQWEQIYEHGQYVACLAGQLAQQMKLSAEECDRLRLAGWMHDIGKACLPEELLAKPGPLNPDERRLMDWHVELGVSLAQALGADQGVQDYIHHHHSVPADAMTLQATASMADPKMGILAVADTLAAMTSQRPYARPRSLNTAMNEIRCLRGQRYDPQVVDVLAQCSDRLLRPVA